MRLSLLRLPKQAVAITFFLLLSRPLSSSQKLLSFSCLSRFPSRDLESPERIASTESFHFDLPISLPSHLTILSSCLTNEPKDQPEMLTGYPSESAFLSTCSHLVSDPFSHPLFSSLPSEVKTTHLPNHQPMLISIPFQKEL